MIGGLHKIDWSAMHHADGPAIEVPNRLENLRSPEAEVRDGE